MVDRKRTDELTVITKAYDLILWSCNHTGRFPRNHHFVLGERIERNLYDLLETLIRAKYSRQRQDLLEQANLLLEARTLPWTAASSSTAISSRQFSFPFRRVRPPTASSVRLP
jgi:hypothetical protein